MILARRVQLSRAKGSKRPLGVVVCDRSSLWGNPFVIVKRQGFISVTGGPRVHAGGDFETEEAAAVFAVDLFALCLRHDRLEFSVADARRELAGKDLGCWCKLSALWCHVDVLLRVAAGGEP